MASSPDDIDPALRREVRAAGLVYVLDDQPGIRRQRCGKGFSYRDADGCCVRDAGHLGLESFVSLLPAKAQRVAEALIQLLVALFAILMASSGWEWMQLKWSEPKPILAIPEAFDYLPLLIGGALMLLFCVEQLIALWRNEAVESAGV